MTCIDKALYVTPSIDTVEKVLYIALREETDAMRNTVLPTNFPPEALLYVQYIGGVMNICAFPERPMKASRGNEKLWQRMVEQRAWYFRWMANGLGPVMISRDLAATLKSHVAHVDTDRVFIKAEPLDNNVKFLNNHLYVPLPPKVARYIIS